MDKAIENLERALSTNASPRHRAEAIDALIQTRIREHLEALTQARSEAKKLAAGAN